MHIHQTLEPRRALCSDIRHLVHVLSAMSKQAGRYLPGAVQLWHWQVAEKDKCIPAEPCYSWRSMARASQRMQLCGPQVWQEPAKECSSVALRLPSCRGTLELLTASRGCQDWNCTTRAAAELPERHWLAGNSLPQATRLARSVGPAPATPRHALASSWRPPEAVDTAKQRAHVMAQNGEEKEFRAKRQRTLPKLPGTLRPVAGDAEARGWRLRGCPAACARHLKWRGPWPWTCLPSAAPGARSLPGPPRTCAREGLLSVSGKRRDAACAVQQQSLCMQWH